MDSQVLNLDADTEQQRNIFYLDEERFHFMTVGCPRAGVEMLRQLFTNFFTHWSSRKRNGKCGLSIILAFLRFMAVNGVPINCKWYSMLRSSKNSGYQHALMDTLYKMYPTRNIQTFFQDVSKFESLLHWNHYLAMEGIKHTKKHDFHLRYTLNRAKMLHFVRNLNYHGMAYELSYTRSIRGKTKYNCMVQNMCAFQFALQILIASNRGKKVDLTEKIFQLAQNSTKCMPHLTDNPILGFLCEFLITVLVLNHLDTVAAIVSLESVLDFRSKYYKHVKTWNAYRRLAEYMMLQEGIGNLVVDQQLLAEELEDQMKVFPDEKCAVFAEAAIRLYHVSDAYDKLISCLIQYSKQAPRRAQRMITFMKNSDLEDDVDVVIENACRMEENKVHPSEIIWLDWCERRLKNPVRYGPLEEVYSKCAQVLFQFLDYGQNRTNERAWKALHFTLPNVENQLVAPLWRERYSWWPLFHNDRIRLSPEIQRYRHEIFVALHSEIPV